MASFNPMTEEESKLCGLLKAGPGEFEVIKAVDKISTNGNPYLNVELLVWDQDGRQQKVFDTLMYSGGMAFKLRHFCYASGNGNAYEVGAIDPDELTGAKGGCTIGHKDDSKTGRKNNEIKEYLVPDQTKAMPRYQTAKTASMKPPDDCPGDIVPGHSSLPQNVVRDNRANRQTSMAAAAPAVIDDIPFAPNLY